MSRLKSYVLLPLGLASLASLPALALATAPVEGTPMLIVAPYAPGGAAGVMARAQARLVRALPWGGFVVASEDPELARRLYAAGASLVLSSRIPAGCTP